MNSNKTQIIKVMEYFGFKAYSSKTGTYFLQTSKQFKPMSKIKLSELETVFQTEEITPINLDELKETIRKEVIAELASVKTAVPTPKPTKKTGGRK